MHRGPVRKAPDGQGGLAVFVGRQSDRRRVVNPEPLEVVFEQRRAMLRVKGAPDFGHALQRPEALGGAARSLCLEQGIELIRDVLQAPLPLTKIDLVQRSNAVVVMKLHGDSPSSAALTRMLFQEESRDAGEIIRFTATAKQAAALQQQLRLVHVNAATAFFKGKDGDNHADGKTEQRAEALMRKQIFRAGGAFPQRHDKRQSQRKRSNGGFPKTIPQFPTAAIMFPQVHWNVLEWYFLVLPGFAKRIKFHFLASGTRPSRELRPAAAVLWKCPPPRAFTA